MEKQNIKMAILRQEQAFRQQVHELHRVYRVQKQLMTEMQAVQMTQAQENADTKRKPTLEMDHQQWYRNSGEKATPFVEEDFNLELTLGTGNGRLKQENPSNSESGATVSSSTSESESGRQFPESNVTLRFQNESKRHDDQLMQSPWLYQCLSLKSA